MKNTKRTFLLLFIFFASIGFAKAQNIKGGLHLGLGGSQIEGDNYDGYHKFAFEVGGFAQMPLPKNCFIQMELNLAQKGSKKNPDNLLGNMDMYSANLTYISIPLLFQYQYQSFLFEIGPGVEILLNSTEKISGYEVINGIPWNRFSFNGIASLKYKLHKNFTAFFRGNYSFFNTRKRTFTTNNVDISRHGQFNNVLLIGLDYTF